MFDGLPAEAAAVGAGLVLAAAALLAGLPKLHRHQWRERPMYYHLPTRTYSVDRVCTVPGCKRVERRRCVEGARSGDAVEIVKDAFGPWVRVKESR